MKTKERYQRPTTELINLAAEGVIATSFQKDEAGILDTAARSKRNFWDDNE